LDWTRAAIHRKMPRGDRKPFSTLDDATERSRPTMVFSSPSPRLPGFFILCLGLSLGWGLTHIRPAPLRAAGGDRSGESIVTTGPVTVKYDEGSKVQIPLEALYLLDYKGGRLMGTVPSIHQTVGATRTLGTFAERDLVADFKLDLDNGPKPHFLMTTGSLGNYSAGWAPLYVYETATNQLAVYRIIQQSVGTSSRARFELLELRSLAQHAEQTAR
jgi:hypothetical protein